MDSTNTLKCNTCRWLHVILPYMESPYGEFGCMKLEQDLYGIEELDVRDCSHYETKYSEGV